MTTQPPLTLAGAAWSAEQAQRFIEHCYDRDALLEAWLGYSGNWFDLRASLILGKQTLHLHSAADAMRAFDAPGLRNHKVEHQRTALLGLVLDGGKPVVGSSNKLGLAALYEALGVPAPEFLMCMPLRIGSTVAMLLVGAPLASVRERRASPDEFEPLMRMTELVAQQMRRIIKLHRRGELPPHGERIPPRPELEDVPLPTPASPDEASPPAVMLGDLVPEQAPPEPDEAPFSPAPFRPAGSERDTAPVAAHVPEEPRTALGSLPRLDFNDSAGAGDEQAASMSTIPPLSRSSEVSEGSEALDEPGMVPMLQEPLLDGGFREEHPPDIHLRTTRPLQSPFAQPREVDPRDMSSPSFGMVEDSVRQTQRLDRDQLAQLPSPRATSDSEDEVGSVPKLGMGILRRPRLPTLAKPALTKPKPQPQPEPVSEESEPAGAVSEARSEENHGVAIIAPMDVQDPQRKGPHTLMGGFSVDDVMRAREHEEQKRSLPTLRGVSATPGSGASEASDASSEPQAKLKPKPKPRLGKLPLPASLAGISSIVIDEPPTPEPATEQEPAARPLPSGILRRRAESAELRALAREAQHSSEASEDRPKETMRVLKPKETMRAHRPFPMPFTDPSEPEVVAPEMEPAALLDPSHASDEEVSSPFTAAPETPDIPEPVVAEDEDDLFDVAPVAVDEAPAVEDAPEPVADAPEPVADAPEPVADAPEPVADAPEPVADAPEEHEVAPQPLVDVEAVAPLIEDVSEPDAGAAPAPAPVAAPLADASSAPDEVSDAELDEASGEDALPEVEVSADGADSSPDPVDEEAGMPEVEIEAMPEVEIEAEPEAMPEVEVEVMPEVEIEAMPEVEIEPERPVSPFERPIPPVTPQAEQLAKAILSYNRETAFRAAQLAPEHPGVLGLIAREFPGALVVDRLNYPMERMPAVEEHSAALQALSLLGAQALPILPPLLNARRAEVRFYALFLCVNMPIVHVLGLLLRGLADPDPWVKKSAEHALLQHTKQPESRALLTHGLRHAFMQSHEDPDYAEPLARLLGELRDVQSVTMLAESLDRHYGHAHEAIGLALRRITLQPLPSSTIAWKTWMGTARGETRRGWLYNAVNSHSEEIRKFAAEELELLPGLHVDYRHDYNPRMRNLAQQALLEWFKAHPE